MNTDTEALVDRITRLENQMRWLRRAVFLIWPVLWIISVFVIFTTTKLDAGAIHPFLNWLGALIFGFGVATITVLSLFFLIKAATDFRNRKDHFPLNPGSKKH
jgi:hypothetical protein